MDCSIIDGVEGIDIEGWFTVDELIIVLDEEEEDKL